MDIRYLRVGSSPEINMTPMIDIMLVLFVIFVLLNRQQKGFDVTLPAGDGASAGHQIVLELPEGGGYRLNGSPVSHWSLGARLTDVYRDRPEKILFIEAGDSRLYQEVVDASDLARGAGVRVIGYSPRHR